MLKTGVFSRTFCETNRWDFSADSMYTCPRFRFFRGMFWEISVGWQYLIPLVHIQSYRLEQCTAIFVRMLEHSIFSYFCKKCTYAILRLGTLVWIAEKTLKLLWNKSSYSPTSSEFLKLKTRILLFYYVIECWFLFKVRTNRKQEHSLTLVGALALLKIN